VTGIRAKTCLNQITFIATLTVKMTDKSTPLIYPPAYGIYDPTHLPATFDPIWSRFWKYTPQAVAAIDTLPPDAPYDPTTYHIEFAQKEEIIVLLDSDPIFTKASPNDLKLAFSTPPELFVVKHNKTPTGIYSTRWAVDRFKSEPGTAAEIASRWGQECYARQIKLKRKHKAWWYELNYLPPNRSSVKFTEGIMNHLMYQRVLADNVFRKQCPGWMEETEQYEVEKLRLSGMMHVLGVIKTCENGHQCDRKNAEALQKAEETRLQREKEIRERNEATLARQNEEKRLREEEKQRKAQKEEEDKKKQEEESKQREAFQMGMQARIATYQNAVKDLSGQLQAGTISPTEYSAQLVLLSQLLK
jgi:hypothetical protein